MPGKQTSHENLLEASLNNENIVINIDDKNYKTFDKNNLIDSSISIV